jgi:hypothetical protein
MNISKILSITTALLLVPLLASQFVEGWNWSPSDYVFAWIMFSGTGLMFGYLANKYRERDQRLAAGVALAAVFMLVWGTLAVGFIGGEDEPANLLVLGVVLVAAVASLTARFDPRKMPSALFVAAGAQALVPFVALALWGPPTNPDPAGIAGVIAMSGFFAFLWVTAGLLFKGGKAVELIGWIFGAGVAAVGLINSFWGNDPGFGVFLILLALVYLPPVEAALRRATGLAFPRTLKILLGVFLIWAAVGVGELFDKLGMMMRSLPPVQ